MREKRQNENVRVALFKKETNSPAAGLSHNREYFKDRNSLKDLFSKSIFICLEVSYRYHCYSLYRCTEIIVKTTKSKPPFFALLNVVRR